MLALQSILLRGCATLAPLCSALAGGQDILVLQDGRIFDGLTLEQAEGGVTIHYEHGDVFTPQSLILDAIIESQPSWEPSTEEEREKAEKGLVPYEGKWMSPSRRDKLIAARIQERREQIEDMEKHRLWRFRHQKKTKHFNFEFTVPEHLFDPFIDKMEAYFSAFAKDWKVKQPRDLGRLTVCFYNDREHFQQVSGAGYGVLGYFRFVEPLELDFFFDRLDMPLTEEVMYHETNHYLQKLIDVDFSYPHFPGESLAEYYAASHYDPETKKFVTGQILEGRLAEVQSDVLADDMMGLRKLITTEGMYDHYTWGWTLVHFLMSERDTAKQFKKFILALPHDKDVKRESQFGSLKTVTAKEVLRVFMDRMDLDDEEELREMEKAWHAYVREKLEFVSHRGLEKAAMNASRQGLKIKSKRLFQEAIDAGTRNPMTFHRFAQVLDREGESAKAGEMWKRALALDPLGAQFYLSLGKMHHDDGDEEKGLELMRLALEIDEDIVSWGFDRKLLEKLQDDGE